MPMANAFQIEYENCQQKGCPDSERVTCISQWDFNVKSMQTGPSQWDSEGGSLRPKRPWSVTAGKLNTLISYTAEFTGLLGFSGLNIESINIFSV